ncbi:DUF5697 family protein [Macellibacteroides fermentans]|uniref:DUF5697 family protein n=1 Tax=Macellibacteroides fermentans TaxID=879969 RepID=UPI00406C2E86
MNEITNQYLTEKIMKMVKTFHKIETAHVYRMFEDQKDSRIEWCIRALKNEGRIVQDAKKLYIAEHKYELAKPVDEKMMAAIWTMINFGKNRITGFCKLEYPKHILCIIKVGDNHLLYEITASSNSDTEELQIAMADGKLKNEHTSNIVIVEDDLAGKALVPDGFDIYCILNEENRPEFNFE